MRDLDRNQRDVGLAVLGRDDRRHLFVGVEFDDEIDLFAGPERRRCANIDQFNF